MVAALDPPKWGIAALRGTRALPWRRPRREGLLLVLVAFAALTPVYSIDAQDVSRLCLTQALLQGRLSNDACLSTPYARDRSEYRGHLYSDKAPGMSVLELSSAVAVRLPTPDHWQFEGLQLWAVRVLTSGIAFLVCAFMIGRISEGLAPGYGGISMVAFGLGTLMAPLAATSFEHVTAAALGLGAFALAWRRQPLLAGLVAGIAVDIEYEAAIVLAVLAVYVAVQGRRPLLEYLAGALPGIVLLGVYDWAAFGAPWHVSYRYKSEEFASRQSSGFFGIHLPRRDGLRLVFVDRGGLLRISPIVLAAAAGLVLLARRFRAEAVVCAAVTLGFVLLTIGYFDPYGGLSPGPRFIVPALPFLALGLGPAFARAFKLTTVLMVLSIVPITALTLTWANGPPDRIWTELERIPGELGTSQIVRSLTVNLLHWTGSPRWLAALAVSVTAVAAVVLALPPRRRPSTELSVS